MRTLRLGALGVLCPGLAPGVGAMPPPTETDVIVRGLAGGEDGTGVLEVRARVQGDAALCTGRLRLVVVDLSEDRVVVDRGRTPAPLRATCAASRDVRRVHVRP